MAEPPYVFISYSNDQWPFVRAVADELRLHGVQLWIDRERLAAGTRWADAKADALVSAEIVLVFVGDSTDSPWMNFEIGAAVGRDKAVVPVYLTADGRRGAPSLLAHFVGIDAHDQKPAEAAHQIADVIRGVQRPQPA
jgi:hypothetical protein